MLNVVLLETFYLQKWLWAIEHFCGYSCRVFFFLFVLDGKVNIRPCRTDPKLGISWSKSKHVRCERNSTRFCCCWCWRCCFLSKVGWTSTPSPLQGLSLSRRHTIIIVVKSQDRLTVDHTCQKSESTLNLLQAIPSLERKETWGFTPTETIKAY